MQLLTVPLTLLGKVAIQLCPKCGGDGKRLEYIELLPPRYDGTAIHKVKEPGLKYGAWNEKHKGWEIIYWRTHDCIITKCSCGILDSDGR
jgi:hypothetical protein